MACQTQSFKKLKHRQASLFLCFGKWIGVVILFLICYCEKAGHHAPGSIPTLAFCWITSWNYVSDLTNIKIGLSTSTHPIENSPCSTGAASVSQICFASPSKSSAVQWFVRSHCFRQTAQYNLEITFPNIMPFYSCLRLRLVVRQISGKRVQLGPWPA